MRHRERKKIRNRIALVVFVVAASVVCGLIPAFAATSAPTKLAADVVLNDSVQLSWSAVSGAVTYSVYQDGSEVGSGISGTSWDVSALSPDSVYAFTVTAVDSTGAESNPSAELDVQTEGYGWSLGTYGVFVLVGMCAGAVAGLMRLILR